MTLRKIFFSFAFFLLAATAGLAQSKTQQIDNLIKTYHKFGQFNGTVLVAKSGKVIYKKGHGMADMEWEIPNQPDTKFRIGSVTKQFTAAIILQLVEEGKIKLDGKITDYLPDYRKDTGDKITIHQLLNHTSGIPSYTDVPGFNENYSRNPSAIDTFVKKFASGDLEFEPGSNWSYNNSGYYILGAIIEKLDQRSYTESLQKRVLNPAGMRETGYDTHAVVLRKRARGYQKSLINEYENAPYIDTVNAYAAGAMYSTVGDLFKWDQALYTDKILSAKSKQLMFTPGLKKYGYGFFNLEFNIGGIKLKVLQHGGGIHGFSCDFTRVVDQKHSIVILDNIGYGRYHGEMVKSIIHILNDLPAKMPKPSGLDVLMKSARQDGYSAASSEFLNLAAKNTDQYHLFENEFNDLGYKLLEKAKVKDAIEVFKLNVALFPKQPNPYDSLGEAYLTDGNKDLALLNYKKSVELDPSNSNALQVINRLEGKKTSGTKKVDSAILDTYLGEYEIQKGFTITVSREGEKLMAVATGQGKEELEPSSDNEFKVPSIGATVTFEKNSDGKIIGLVLNQSGQTIKAKKIK